MDEDYEESGLSALTSNTDSISKVSLQMYVFKTLLTNSLFLGSVCIQKWAQKKTSRKKSKKET